MAKPVVSPQFLSLGMLPPSGLTKVADMVLPGGVRPSSKGVSPSLEDRHCQTLLTRYSSFCACHPEKEGQTVTRDLGGKVPFVKGARGPDPTTAVPFRAVGD